MEQPHAIGEARTQAYLISAIEDSSKKPILQTPPPLCDYSSTQTKHHTEAFYSPFHFEYDLNPVIHRPFMKPETNIKLHNYGGDRLLDRSGNNSYWIHLNESAKAHPFEQGRDTSPEILMPSPLSSEDDGRLFSDDMETPTSDASISISSNTPKDEMGEAPAYHISLSTSSIKCSICLRSFRRQGQLKWVFQKSTSTFGSS